MTGYFIFCCCFESSQEVTVREDVQLRITVVFANDRFDKRYSEQISLFLWFDCEHVLSHRQNICKRKTYI